MPTSVSTSPDMPRRWFPTSATATRPAAWVRLACSLFRRISNEPTTKLARVELNPLPRQPEPLSTLWSRFPRHGLGAAIPAPCLLHRPGGLMRS